MPKVTIALPFYNNARYLLDTVRSVFAQTYQDWELLLTDDGSSDRSLELAAALHDSRVKIFSDGKNMGVSARLNEMTCHAQGELLLRLDADDLMHPTRVAKIVAYFDAHPETDAVFTACYEIDETNCITGWQPIIRRNTAQEVLRKGFNPAPTLAIKSAWGAAHRYDERLPRGEDLALWCNCFSETTFGYIDKPLYYSRRISGYSLRKYAITIGDHSKVRLKYGPSLLGIPATCILLLQGHAKIAVQAAAKCFGMTSLTRRWSLLPVPDDSIQEQQRTI